MTREAVETRILDLMRSTVLAGRDVRIASDQPLGAQGLGLDSMAFLEMATAIENLFDVDIPESLWLEKGRITLADLVEAVRRAQPEQRADGRPHAPVRLAPRPQRSWASRLARRVHARDRYFILGFDLAEPLAELAPPPGVVLREGTEADLEATHGLWPAHIRERNRLQFRERLAAGLIACVAARDGRIVALDWIADETNPQRAADLMLQLRPGSSLAFDLNEHPSHKGQGIGVATIAFTMKRAKERGFRRQFTTVDARNGPMLRAAIQLLGFEKVGTIDAVRTLGRSRAAWTLDEPTGERELRL